MDMGDTEMEAQRHSNSAEIHVGEHVWVAFYYDGDPAVISQQQTSVAHSLRPGPPPQDEMASSSSMSEHKETFVVRSVCMVSYLDEQDHVADLIRVYDGAEYTVPLAFLSHLPSRRNLEHLDDDMEKAIVLKEEGNYFFKCKDFDSARQIYEAALGVITRKPSAETLKVGALVLVQREQVKLARELLYRPASVALMDGGDMTCEVVYEDDLEPNEEELKWNQVYVLPPRRAHEGHLDDLSSQPLELYRQLCMNTARALLNFAPFSTDRGTYVRYSILSADKAICSCYLLRSSGTDQNAADIISAMVTGFFFRIKAHCALGQFKTGHNLLESSRQLIFHGTQLCEANPEHPTAHTLEKQKRQLQQLERHITISQRQHQKADRKIAKEVAHWVDHAWKEGGGTDKETHEEAQHS